MEPTGIIVDFLQRFLADQESGQAGTLESYQELYPGYEELIASEYASLSREDGDAIFPETLSPGDMLPGGREALGKYRLLGEIGRGGQGVVYRAMDTSLGREVALKVLNVHGAPFMDALRRFTREATLASRLDDPGICAVYETGTVEGLPYIAMRLVPGETLAHHIAREPAGDRAAVLTMVRVVEDVARSLHRAHEEGVLHRDLKPGNIMVTPDGKPVILDFGLAAAEAADGAAITRTGDIQGTLPYMSPEQLRGRPEDIDRRVDVYALGAVLYEGLTGARPHQGPTREALCRAIELEEPPLPWTRNPHVTRDLSMVVTTALSKERRHRYSSALDLADDLRRYRSGEPVAARPPSALGRVVRWARRRPARAALLAVIAVALPLLAGLGGFILANLSAIDAQKDLEHEAAISGLLAAGYRNLGEGPTVLSLASFEEVLRRSPDRLEAVVGMALALLYVGRGQDALDFLAGKQASVERSAGLRQLRETLRYKLRMTDTRVVDDPAGRATPTDLFVSGSVALHLAHLDEDPQLFSDAFDDIHTAVLATPVPPALWYFELAHAASHVGERRLVAPITEALVRLWPESAMALYWAGFAWRSLDRERSLMFFERSAALQPDYGKTFEHMGHALGGLGRYEESERALRRALEIGEESGTLRVLLGQALKGQGRLDEAEVQLRRGLFLDPTRSLGSEDLSFCLSRRGDLEGAEEVLRQALEHAPENHFVRTDLAAILGKRGKTEAAIAELQQAVKSHPEHGPAWSMLGFGLHMTGAFAEAVVAYGKAFAIRPTGHAPGAYFRASEAALRTSLGAPDEVDLVHQAHEWMEQAVVMVENAARENSRLGQRMAKDLEDRLEADVWQPVRDQPRWSGLWGRLADL